MSVGFAQVDAEVEQAVVAAAFADLLAGQRLQAGRAVRDQLVGLFLNRQGLDLLRRLYVQLIKIEELFERRGRSVIVEGVAQAAVRVEIG